MVSNPGEKVANCVLFVFWLIIEPHQGNKRAQNQQLFARSRSECWVKKNNSSDLNRCWNFSIGQFRSAMQRIVNLCFLFSIFFYSCKSQPPIPPPERPGCNEGWQSPDLTYVPSINQCSGYTSGLGIACSPSNPFTCTGRNPFCATAGDRVFKCCSDRIQDSMEVSHLNSTEIKPICPSGAIPYKMPHVLLCDPTIVNLCPYEYKCVEAANGHQLPADGRSLCCKTSTLYSFASVFREAKLSPLIVPNPPLSAIEYVTLNVHTSAKEHSPEIRIGDHFVLTPYKLYEPAYLKKIKLFTDFGHGSFVHVILFDPMSTTETMQLYYDRPTSNGKSIHLDEPIPDGGFISKKIFNAAPITNIENPTRPGPIKEYKKRWIVLVFKTVNPLGRVYVLSSKDLHSKYRSVTEFLKSDTGNMLGTPVAGTFFYLTTD